MTWMSQTRINVLKDKKGTMSTDTDKIKIYRGNALLNSIMIQIK